MLSLSDPRWSVLSHAYGKAQDVPTMLRALTRDVSAAGDSDVWQDIWSALCHQGTVYTATYAAVPHIVGIAAGLAPSERAEFIHFVGAVAASTDAAAIPTDLAEDYLAALDVCHGHVELSLAARPGDWHSTLYLLEALVALRGCKRAAQVLSRLADTELIVTCPACEHEMYVTVAPEGWYSTAEDPVRVSNARRTEMVGGPGCGEALDSVLEDANAPAHLISVARSAGEVGLAEDLGRLCDSVECPTCGLVFPLYARALE